MIRLEITLSCLYHWRILKSHFRSIQSFLRPVTSLKHQICLILILWRVFPYIQIKNLNSNLSKTNWYACHIFGLILSRYEKMRNSSTISFPFYGHFSGPFLGPQSNIFHVRWLFRFLGLPQAFWSCDHLKDNLKDWCGVEILRRDQCPSVDPWAGLSNETFILSNMISKYILK